MYYFLMISILKTIFEHLNSIGFKEIHNSDRFNSLGDEILNLLEEERINSDV